MTQMYICMDCGTVFDEENSGCYTEYYGEGVMRGPVHYMVCPKCKSDDYNEAQECCACGEYYDSENDMIHVDDCWYCEKCAGEVAGEYLFKWGYTDTAKYSVEAYNKRFEKIKAMSRGAR